MTEAVTAKQIFEHLSPYDLERVTFQMPDGLAVVAVYIDTDTQGGAIVTLSDVLASSNSWSRGGGPMQTILIENRESDKARLDWKRCECLYPIELWISLQQVHQFRWQTALHL